MVIVAPASEASVFVSLTISSIVWVAEAATGLSRRSVITVVIIITNFRNCHLLLLRFLNFGREVVFSIVAISTANDLFRRLNRSNSSLIEAAASAEVLKHVTFLTVVSDRTWCPLYLSHRLFFRLNDRSIDTYSIMNVLLGPVGCAKFISLGLLKLHLLIEIHLVCGLVRGESARF